MKKARRTKKSDKIPKSQRFSMNRETITLIFFKLYACAYRRREAALQEVIGKFVMVVSVPEDPRGFHSDG